MFDFIMRSLTFEVCWNSLLQMLKKKANFIAIWEALELLKRSHMWFSFVPMRVWTEYLSEWVRDESLRWLAHWCSWETRPWYDVSCWKFLPNLYANQPTAILWHNKPFTLSYCPLITYIIFSDGSKSTPNVFSCPPLRELVLNSPALRLWWTQLAYTADSLLITPASCDRIWL